MSIYSAIATFVATRRTRRLRARTAMRISALPRGIQKDIGWPDADDDFRRRARFATERPQ
jgi:hypothetical protein